MKEASCYELQGGMVIYLSGIQPFFFVHLPLDVISLQPSTPKVVGV
jgi:hypothetical protein